MSAQFTFSGWHVLGSVAFSDGANPYVFILYRCILATLGMYAYVKFCGLSITIDPEDYGRLLMIGFFFFCNVFFCVLALNYISPPRLAIFQPSVPCIASILSVFAGYDRATCVRSLGIITAVAGAIIAELGKADGSSHVETNVRLGTLFLTIQVMSLACQQVFVKPLLHKYAPAVVTFAFSSICLAYLIPVVVVFALAGGISSRDLIFDRVFVSWAAVVYTALFPTLYAYLATSWAIKVLSPSVASVYLAFQPVGTVLLSLVVLGVMLRRQQLLGGVVVIIGLALTILGKPSEEVGLREDDEYNEVARTDDDHDGVIELQLQKRDISTAEP